MGFRDSFSVLALVVAALLAACDSTGPGNHDDPPDDPPRDDERPSELIAYLSGFGSIRTIRPDGSGLRELARTTSEFAGLGYPRWSPDGLFLAYEREDYSNALITRTVEIVRWNGSDLHDYLPAFEFIYGIEWSPQGDRLVVARDPHNFGSHPSGESVLYTVRSDGTDVHRLSDLIYQLPNSFPRFFYASWSPDGRRLAFAQQFEALWTALADGSDSSLIFQGAPVFARWSPSGQRILFVNDRYHETQGTDPRSEIYVINPDGSDPVRLTVAPNSDGGPVWSPDGSRIAFVSTRDGNPEIYLMQSDGSGVVRLTEDAGIDDSPAWSPDGTRLVFVSDRSGNREIYTMNDDGTDLFKVTTSPADEYAPDWH